MNYSRAAYITGQQLFGAGLTPNERISEAFFGSVKIGGFGAVITMMKAGFQAKKAGPGGIVPNMVGRGAVALMAAPIAGFASAGLCLIPVVGPLLAQITAGIMIDYAEERFGASATRGVRLFTDLNKRIRHLEMGGNYRDTLTASRLRFNAVQDMHAALMPSRRYLGQEALLMHR